MNTLTKLMKWDILLLNRNKLFVISSVLALVYIALFFLLKPLGNLTYIIIVLIFNDPVVTGFLFAGVLLLFDKNQNTLQAISVLPVPIEKYILSKSFVLSLLAVLISFIMSFAAVGFTFNMVHLFFAVFLSAMMFSFAGFIFGGLSSNFNQFLAYSIPFFILSAVPFLALFGIVNIFYFLPIPSMGSVGLIQSAFMEVPVIIIIICYLHLVLWTYVSWQIASKIIKRGNL